MATYLILGRRMAPEDAGFHDALAAAHASRHRPLCLCRPEGLPMYVARFGSGLIVKRMPDTGGRHAADCNAYDPPAALSGRGELKGSAIVEDPAAGVTSLKLGFAMSKGSSRSNMPWGGDGADSVASDGSRLTMRGLLHYLWDEAELTRWQPAFAGHRSWAVVRKHLLMAAEGKVARGRSLQDQLYVPEPFNIERRDDINARRLALWSQSAKPLRCNRPLMLLIGEVKEIVPARFGYKAVVKHVPDQAFMLDETLYRRMGRRFESELSRWGSSEELHMVMMATFGVGPHLVPSIDELTLMLVTPQWIPVSDAADQQLVERLVHDGRRFVKALRYNLGADRPIASAVLTDTGGEAVPLFFEPAPVDDGTALRMAQLIDEAGCHAWTWHPGRDSMPVLPEPATH